MSIPERIKTRLAKDRPMTSITVRIPDDVVKSMKEIAPQRGFSGYQALLKSYIGEGLRRDEAHARSARPRSCALVNADSRKTIMGTPCVSIS